MKAEFNGVTVEGTPQEIAELIKLVGEIKAAPVYVPPYQPWPEVRPYPVTWGGTATCRPSGYQVYYSSGVVALN